MVRFAYTLLSTDSTCGITRAEDLSSFGCFREVVIRFAYILLSTDCACGISRGMYYVVVIVT